MLGDSRKQREGSRAGVGQFLDRGDTKMVGKHCYHLRISVDYLGFPHFSSGLGQLSSHEFRFGWIWKIRRIGLWACFFSPRTPFDVEHIYIYISQIEPYTNHTHTHIYINHILTMYFPFVKRSFAPSSPTVVSFSLSPSKIPNQAFRDEGGRFHGGAARPFQRNSSLW